MPIIATVDGARLMMYANDRPPPHFHVLIAEHRAVIDVRTLRLTRGRLPKARLRTLIKWAEPRRLKLLNAWDMTQTHQFTARIR